MQATPAAPVAATDKAETAGNTARSARRILRRGPARRAVYSPAALAPTEAAPARKFDPARYLIRVNGGKEYLEVSWRLVWFRQDRPNWGILTELVEQGGGGNQPPYVIFKASIFDDAGKLIATAHKYEDVKGFRDYREKAETGAVGRALAMCGYGTQFAPELAEEDRLADAPQNRGRQSAPAPRSAAPTPRPARQEGQRPTGGQTFRNSAPPPPDEQPDAPAPRAPRPVQQTPPPENIVDRVCSDPNCGHTLTSAQFTLSKNKYGRPLCPIHQRNATPAPPPASVEDEPEDNSEPSGVDETEEAQAAALNRFAKRAFDMGFDVTTVIKGKREYSPVKVGPLIVQASGCEKPGKFGGWMPSVSILEQAIANLPRLQAEKEEADRTARPAAPAVSRETVPARGSRPPADDFDKDLTDPFAE